MNHTIKRHLVAALLALGPVVAVPAQLIPDIGKRSASGTLSGLWKGTASEQVEGAGEQRFPIEMRFSGPAEKLALKVTGRGQVRTEDGERVSFVITAEYRGAMREGKLQMRSERVETRLVEYDEVIAAQPQTMTAQLVAGELRGRVGSEAEGWTTFSARAAGKDDRREEPVSGGFVGAWQGTVREPGPDGRPLSYPMQVKIAAAGGELRAELSADMQVPTGEGNTVPVEYRAAFRGAASGGELRLESESVRYRIVSQNRTEEGPKQRVTGRHENGVLRLTLNSDGNAATQIELRRVDAGGQEGGGGRRRGGNGEVLIGGDEEDDAGREVVNEVVKEDVDEDDIRRKDSPRPEPRKIERGGPAPYSTLVLEPLEVRDPGLGNAHSHTLMVPQGWRFDGGVRWTMNPDSFVHFVGTLHGQQKEEVAFGPSYILKFESLNGQPVGGAENAALGADGTIVRRSPQRYGEIAVEVLLPRMRPGATDVRLVEAARMPKVEEFVRTVYAEVLQTFEKGIEQARQDGAMVPDTKTDADMFLVAERARVRYREDGQEWEEEFRSTQFGHTMGLRTSYMVSERSFCGVFDVRSFRAPVGQLESRLPTLLSLAGTLSQTPAWSIAIQQMSNEIARARAAGRQAAFEAAQRTAAATASADVSDIQMQGWRKQQDSVDRMQKATIDSIHETQDFRHSDGKTYTFTNQFDRAFMNAGGQVVLTNDTGLQPGADPRFGGVNWQEMQRVDPLRRK